MENKYWKQTMLEQSIIWCKVIRKYAMGVRAMSIHTCQWSSLLTVASLFFFRSSKRPDDYQLIPKPFFQNVVLKIILLSWISFSAQFPEGRSTLILRLECTWGSLHVIPIKHQKLGRCNRNQNYFVQRLFSVSAAVSFFYINIPYRKPQQIQESLHSNTYL